MSANRVAALGGTAASVVTVAITLLDQFENETLKAIVLATALVCITAIVVVFLLGSHKYDALIFGNDPVDPEPVPQAVFPDPDDSVVSYDNQPTDFDISPDIDRS